MKKAAVALSLLCAMNSTQGTEGMTCPSWEYARLKDASRQELAAEYCRATARAKMNSDISAIRKQSFDRMVELGSTRDATRLRRELTEISEARTSCVGAAEEAAGMLKKKFKAPEPRCP